jgi:hypothetical protein
MGLNVSIDLLEENVSENLDDLGVAMTVSSYT